MSDEHAITPGVLGLIALLSIGGLLFLGFEAKIAGEATALPTNVICCTTQTWQNAPIGWVQGNAETNTLFCFPHQTAAGCCYQQMGAISNLPIKVLGVRDGPCSPGVPERSYPIMIT